jgi:phosphonoacetate hydrolase
VGPADRARRALEVLISPALEAIVEMALLRVERDCFEAWSHDGSVRFSRERDSGGWAFRVEGIEGHDPLANRAPDCFPTLAAERAGLRPHRLANSYPFAYLQVSQLFDHPAAPDICVVHTAAHHWGERGGHIGEHGSMDVVQARSPLVFAGPGIRSLGQLEDACLLIDVAPTVLCLLGCAPGRGVARDGSVRDGLLLARQDGRVLTELLDGSGRPDHVVGILLDGCNSNVLLDLVAAGAAPNIGRLMAGGATFRCGAVSCLPTVTLPNHTSILSGCFPGHHGLLHNAWYDRSRREQVVTNSPSEWPTSMRWLKPGIETIHTALLRHRPGALTISVNEPCDVGASYSTFDVIRRKEPFEAPAGASYATDRFVSLDPDYRWSTVVDDAAVAQFEGIWSGEYRGRRWGVPDFSWVNFTLTDSAFHAGGPYSEIAAASVADSDRRIGALLAAVERRGAYGRTAFFVVADHGMEETDPEVRGDWAPALAAAGVAFRDEGFGFLYLEDP